MTTTFYLSVLDTDNSPIVSLWDTPEARFAGAQQNERFIDLRLTPQQLATINGQNPEPEKLYVVIEDAQETAVRLITRDHEAALAKASELAGEDAEPVEEYDGTLVFIIDGGNRYVRVEAHELQ